MFLHYNDHRCLYYFFHCCLFSFPVIAHLDVKNLWLFLKYHFEIFQNIIPYHHRSYPICSIRACCNLEISLIGNMKWNLPSPACWQHRPICLKKRKRNKERGSKQLVELRRIGSIGRHFVWTYFSFSHTNDVVIFNVQYRIFDDLC